MAVFNKIFKGSLGGLVIKNPSANAGDAGSIPGLRRSPVKGNSNPLQSCLGNPTYRGAWQVTVHGATKKQNMT